MRKQTKLVAVASAAALLAIGASMTSFAAAGWVEEDGTWYYYDKDGNKVEDEWKKSGDNWYWLDSEEGGAMAVDKLIEDDDDTYYVDSNGVMVRNQWVAVVNEDQDEDEDPAEYHYYYLQSNGKAYKSSDSTTKFKTIEGKRYAFDEDGKMLYGWVAKSDANLVSTDDDSWETCEYYLGDWTDGAMKTGWQKISVWDEDEDDYIEHWFNFKSNGVKRMGTTNNIHQKKLNGKTYGFDERGVMTYEWTLTTGNNASTATTSDWKYFSSPEDGARVTKGWFKVVAPDDDGDDNTFKDYNGTFVTLNGNGTSDATEENERWYYADGDGELYKGAIKKIKGKYYGFAPDGDKAASMLTGLCAISVDNTGAITRLYARNMDADDLEDCMDGGTADGTSTWNAFAADTDASLYYFGNNEDEDGAMKVGATTINLDGDSYNFFFSKTGNTENRGRGITGIDDDKYIYRYGMKIKADNDDKYKVVYANGDKSASGVTVFEVSSSALRANYMSSSTNQNSDGDTVRFVGTLDNNYYLVNASGSIVKNKTAAKDGDEWYFYVDNKQIKMYTNTKNLNGVKNSAGVLQDVTDDNGLILKDKWDDTTVSIESGNNGNISQDSNLWD